MATATLAIGRNSTKGQGPDRSLGDQILGYGVIIGCVLIWLMANLVADPNRFLGSVLVGLQNGMLYALVALGYTMVYGIIELINFAHGDLFMLVDHRGRGRHGHRCWASAPSSAASILPLLIALIACMAFGALVNVVGRVFAYRRVALGAEAGPADDCGRPELRLPRHRPAGLHQPFDPEELAGHLGWPDRRGRLHLQAA